MMVMPTIKEVLKYVDPLILQNKIDRFRILDFRKLSQKEIAGEVNKVLYFETINGNYMVFQRSTSSYPSGTKFFRARRIHKENDGTSTLMSMQNISSCWEPPKEIVQWGRLNKPGEPLLYTSPRIPAVAIEELKPVSDDVFGLIIYEAIEDINVTMIGKYPVEELDQEDLLKAKMMEDFLCHEFMRDVGKGTEYLYKISEHIAKFYFDLPPQIQDAWCYPSMTQKNYFNVCFRPDKAKEKLKFIQVEIISIKKIESDNAYKIIATGINNHNDLSYFCRKCENGIDYNAVHSIFFEERRKMGANFT